MKNKAYIILSGIMLMFASCKNHDDLFIDYIVRGGLDYPGKVNHAVAKPGNRRIELSWPKIHDPKVVKARIFWNNYSDSVEIAINHSLDTTRYEINPINENIYSFRIHTYDAEGNISVPEEVISTVYGDNYRNGLSNRVMMSYVYDGLDITLNWRGAANKETGIILKYTDIYGNKEMLITPDETSTFIPDIDLSYPLTYNTVYLPEPSAIDTFQTVTAKISVDPVIQIPTGTWREHPLTGDLTAQTDFPVQNIWQDAITGNSYFTTPSATLVPGTITWDLGVYAKLYRMRLWPRQHNDDRWTGGHPKVFEIYGSTEEPNPNGSMDGWNLIGRFECFQPSGGPAVTQADIDLAAAGIEFEFAPDAETVRYIRLRCETNFSTTIPQTKLTIAKISFWGRMYRN